MPKINARETMRYVENHIGGFHQKRIEGIEALKLPLILKRKNPYLFRAKNVLTAEQLVRGLADAHISSNEETLFGDWLEGLVIFVCGKAFGGRKSGIRGIDLEFDRDGSRYIVAVKSGPNWGNSGQVAKMRSDFKTAQKILRTGNSRLQVAAVNGCCYGKDSRPDKGDYFKFCGQRFWEFISADASMYVNIIEPLGHRAKEQNTAFAESYARAINKLSINFAKSFCDRAGNIDWKALTKFNSGAA